MHTMIMLASLTTIETMEVTKVDCTSIKQGAICFGKTRWQCKWKKQECASIQNPKSLNIRYVLSILRHLQLRWYGQEIYNGTLVTIMHQQFKWIWQMTPFVIIVSLFNVHSPNFLWTFWQNFAQKLSIACIFVYYIQNMY
jgi:hypothetical protein